MVSELRRWLCSVLVVFAAAASLATPARADEIWVAPTYQQDLGGLGVGSNTFWPVTAAGAVRFAFPVPADLKTLQGVKVSLIPAASSAGSTLTVFVCAAINGSMVGAACQGPFAHPFTSVANQLKEVDISSSVAPLLGTEALRPYVAILAYTAPTTASDHLVGLRFSYGQNILTAATYSTGLGFDSFKLGGTGSANTAIGAETMYFGASGGSNTAIGRRAMYGEGNTLSGSLNTAVGASALAQIASGSMNTAVGVGASQELHSFNSSTAIGYHALFTGAEESTAVGASALSSSNGIHNTGVGYFSINRNGGRRNTAIGAFSMGGPGNEITGGDNNIAIGFRAGFNLLSGDYNILIGHEGGEEYESNTTRIGVPFNSSDASGQSRVFFAGIRGVTTGLNDAVPVVMDSAGQLGTINSSRRLKEDIRDMADTSGRLLKLRPVTFRYTQAYNNGTKPIQFGLIAEEVADVFPELAVRGAGGQVETVHYETLNVLLLNELQKQQARIDTLEQQRDEQQHEQRRRIELLEQQLSDLLSTREPARGGQQ